MSEKTMKYLAPGHGLDEEALKQCLALAVKLSQKKGFKIITFLVPKKKTLIAASLQTFWASML